MRIAVDIDEVLTPLLEGFLSFYNEQHGTSFAVSDCWTYHIEEVMGIPLEQCIREVEAFYRSDAFGQLPPFPEAQQALKQLKEQGHELVVVTSRYGEAIPRTEPWIAKHYPKIFSAIHFVTFRDRDGKAGLCEKEKMDVLIEDDADHVSACKKHGIAIILLEKPWNKDADAVKAKDWQEVLEKIEEKRIRK